MMTDATQVDGTGTAGSTGNPVSATLGTAPKAAPSGTARLQSFGDLPTEPLVAFVELRDDPRSVRALLERFPTLAAVLVIVPNRQLDVQVSSFFAALGERLAFGGTLMLPNEDRSFMPIRRACSELLLAARVPPERVIALSPAPGADGLPSVFDTVITDLLWECSRRWVQRLEPANFDPDDAFRFGKYLLEAGQPLHALRHFLAVSEWVPRRVLAEDVMRSLVAMSCAGPLAASWAESLPWSAAERQNLLAEINGSIESNKASERAMLAANLKALASVDPAAAEAVAEAVPLQFEVGVLPDFPWRVVPGTDRILPTDRPVFLRVEGNKLVDVGTTGDPRTIARNVRAATTGSLQPILIASFSSLTALFHVASERCRSNLPGLRQTLYVVEESLSLVALLCRHVDLSEVFADERFLWFLGPGATDRFEQLLHRRTALPPPVMQLGGGSAAHDAVVRIVAQREAMARERYTRLQQHYHAGFPAEVAAALNGSAAERPRIMLFTTRHSTVLQFVCRDLAEGFTRIGAECEVVIESDYHERMNGPYLLERIERFKPHLFFQLDYIRSDPRSGFPKHLPWISWIIDALPQLDDKESIQRLGPLDFTFVVWTPWVKLYKDKGYPHVAHLPFGSSDVLYNYSSEPVEPVDEVAYICNQGDWPPYFKEYPGLEEAFIAEYEQMGFGGVDPENEVATAERALARVKLQLPPAELESVARRATLMLMRWWLRRGTLKALVDAGIRVALHGIGWERDPEYGSLTRGPVASGAPLAAAYRRSKVVLHNSLGLNSHPRVFEALGSGGFVLARRTVSDSVPGEIDDQLRRDEEIVMYEDLQQMVELVKRAFQDEPWRRGIVERGQRRALAEHTYVARARTVLTEVARQLGTEFRSRS